MSDLIRICSPFPVSFRLFGLFAALMLFICLFAAARPVSAADYAVTSLGDSGNGTLRAAINAANGTTDNDRIFFDINLDICGGTCLIRLTSGELVINSAASAGTLLISDNSLSYRFTISGNSSSRVFYLNSGANLTVKGVTITSGNGNGTDSVDGRGGAIHSRGTLILQNSIVSGSRSFEEGGGIYSQGTLTLTNSTISGNRSSINGGGIYSLSTVTLTNSTISGNESTFEGGGIYSLTTLNLTSVTVTKNKSTSTGCTTCAGGIFKSGSIAANIKNTIIAANTVANASASPDFRGVVAAASSYNLIGNGLGMTGISNNDANQNQVGSTAALIDPKLDTLKSAPAFSTPTHAPLVGSPAIDQGKSFGLTTDQRDYSHLLRPVDQSGINNATNGDGADIGAFELQRITTAASVSISGRVLANSTRGLSNAVVYLTEATGEIRAARTTTFGYYRFADIAVGQTVTITVVSKRFQFAPQMLNITEETEAVNFIAEQTKSNEDF
jgi:predicted outer membrane repeat protein